MPMLACPVGLEISILLWVDIYICRPETSFAGIERMKKYYVKDRRQYVGPWKKAK